MAENEKLAWSCLLIYAKSKLVFWIKALNVEHFSDCRRKPCRRLHHSLLCSSHFTTLIGRFFPNWPILRPAPKYTTGLQLKPNCCTISFSFAQKCSNALKSKVPNDFHVRRVTEKWATIQRNCCRKISILGSEQWKLSPFFVFHAAFTISPLKRSFSKDIVEVDFQQKQSFWRSHFTCWNL